MPRRQRPITREYVVTERVTMVLQWLVEDKERLTTAEVARRLDLSWRRSRDMLLTINRRWPAIRQGLDAWEYCPRWWEMEN